MGEFKVQGIRSSQDLERLKKLLEDYLGEGKDDELINRGTVVWDFTGESVSVDELAFLVDMDNDEYYCTTWQHTWECTCRWDAAYTDPRQGRLVDVTVAYEEFVPFVECSRRGEHLTVTECPLCYGDWASDRADREEILLVVGEDARGRRD